MAELKTQKNKQSVPDFLNAIEDEKKREDSWKILKLMKKVSGEEPAMWGDSIIGFGAHRYRYASGREGDWFQAGFSPRKANLTLYLTTNIDDHAALLGRLGKFKTGKGCLYINKLADVDMKTLEELVKASVKKMRETSVP